MEVSLEFYVILSVVVIGGAYLLRRMTDPRRLERKRVEALRAMAERKEEQE